MQKWALAGFLILYAILGLVDTKVPGFILPLVALFAGGAVLLDQGKEK